MYSKSASYVEIDKDYSPSNFQNRVICFLPTIIIASVIASIIAKIIYKTD